MANVVTIPVGFKPYPWQSEFMKARETSIRVVCPSVRQGKTVVLAAETIILGNKLYEKRLPLYNIENEDRLTPLINFWFVSSTYKLLEQSKAEITRMLPKQFKAKFDKEAGKFLIFPYINNLDKLDYHWHIVMRSAERPDLLVAEGVDLVVFDEARDISRNVFDLTQSRLESGRLNLMIIGGTPGSRLDNDKPFIIGANGLQVENLHWQYEYYLKGQDVTNEKVKSWRFDCYSPQRSPRITEDWIESKKENMSPDTFRRDMLSEFIRYDEELAVIPEYNATLQFKPIQDRYDKRLPLYQVWDFGWLTPAVTVHQVKDGIWLQLAERQGRGQQPLSVFAREALQWLNGKYGDAEIVQVFAPTSGLQHKATDGRTEIDMLTEIYREFGHNLRVNPIVENETTIEHGIDIQRARCGKNEKGEVLSLLDTSCIISNEALSGGWHRCKDRYFKSGQPKPFKDGLFDHVADTRNLIANSGTLDVLGRAVEHRSSIRKQQPIKREQAFWVNT